jgi:hypothetical protein
MTHQGLDVYVVTRDRTRRAAEGFINEFVDVDRAWHRPDDEELMLLPLGATEPHSGDYDWEPSISLGHVVDRGMDRPWRAFFISNLPTLDARLIGATIGFTSDGCLLAGVETETMEEATASLRILINRLDAEIGAATLGPPWFSMAEAEAAITAGWSDVHVRWRRGQADPEVVVPDDIPGRL